MVTVSIWIAEGNEHAACIRFSLEDTGIGIPADALSHHFSPIRQADAMISRRYGGTGLGLSISKRLIEAMGGMLDVESRLGTGGRFCSNYGYLYRLSTLTQNITLNQ